MPNFFIKRPVFAIVIVLLLSLFGIISLQKLPIAQYPDVAPPNISVSARYVGASPEEVAKSVTSVIEENLSGIENMLYYSSSSDSNGNASINITFEPGTEADKAQIDVQNALANVTSMLPTAVTQQGLSYRKKSSGFLLVASLSDETGKLDTLQLADYIVKNIKPQIEKIKGVGDVNLFAAKKAIRIWLDVDKLTQLGLTAGDVNNAISSQHVSIASGIFGAPPTEEAQKAVLISIDGEFKDVSKFNEVILKADSDGNIVKLKDVARVEVGKDTYNTTSLLNGVETASFAVSLSPSANALETEKLVKAELERLSEFFPEGVSYKIPYNTAPFVEASINKVFHTLVEAILLVFVVMYLFLQNVRYTIIPSLVVPVALLATMTCLLFLGFSINTLTMFALVLAIGILVDDAIVVVENVERIMTTERLPVKEATAKAMSQIQGAIVGITLVLITVFAPLLFMSGSAGIIYQQFAVTMAIAIAFSGFLALTFTPALCGLLLKANHHENINAHHVGNKYFAWFNKGMDALSKKYGKFVVRSVRKLLVVGVMFVLLSASGVFVFKTLPTSFVPDEDQGILMTSVQLPGGSTAQDTLDVLKNVQSYYAKNNAVNNVVSIQGFSFGGSGLNNGMAFITLKDFKERDAKGEDGAFAIANNATQNFMKEYAPKGTMVFSLVPPAIQGTGTSSGFSLELQDTSGVGQEKLYEAAQLLVKKANESGVVTNARISGVTYTPKFDMKINREKAAMYGVSISEIRSVLSTAVGSAFVGRFNNEGKLSNIYVQADDKYRVSDESVLNLKVKNKNGDLLDLRNVVDAEFVQSPSQIQRFNGITSISVTGQAKEGYSSGDAMAVAKDIVTKDLKGIGFEWSGISQQEIKAGNEAVIMLSLAVLVVFLVLAALYESFIIPIAALLILPLGMLGTILLTKLMGGSNSVFFQVGLITVMGLSAKNAILIVEFAKDAHQAGKSVLMSAIEAAKIRLRPILMTSLAFIIGVLPLVFASGAGSAGQKAIGIAVLGGMITATIFSIVFVPALYVLVINSAKKLLKRD